MEDQEWIHYLTRPFSLFGASIWHEWYLSNEMQQNFGVTLPDAMYLENPKEVAQSYRRPQQLERIRKKMELLAQEKDRLLLLLNQGVELNKVASDLLSRKRIINNLSEAVDFINKLALYATIIPFFIGDIIKENKDEAAVLVEHLRKESYYPRIYQDIILPLAQKKVKEYGITNPAAVHFLTYNELRSGDVSQVSARMQRYQEGARYAYTVIDNEEKIDFSTKISFVPDESLLEISEEGELNGQCAYPGKVKGKARIVFSPQQEFNAGEILVSINSNPSLMPFIIKSSAIITDEGGIMCHAAIISRELKKPCVIGTKHATSILKNGDVVEVNAEAGTVKILQRRSNPKTI